MKFFRFDLPRTTGETRDAAYSGLLLTAAAANVLIVVIRLWSVLHYGGRVPTSGGEGDGALGVFSVCAHGTLYHDYAHSPNNFIFNYVFYELYGLTARLFGPCTLSTPLTSRLLTLLFVVLLAAVVYLARGRHLKAAEALAVSAAAFSPYIGWWAFAIRPDIGATALFALGLVALLSYLRAPSISSLLASCVCIYAAWGFKQTFVFAVPVMAFYIFRVNRWHAALFLLLLAVGAGLPFLIYDPRAYVLHTILVEARSGVYGAIALANMKLFLVKAAPMLVLAIAVAFGRRQKPPDLGRQFLIVMLVFSFAVLGVAAGKAGAGDNYWMPTFAVAMLLTCRFAAQCAPPLRRGAFVAYAALTLLAAAALLAGLRGNLTLESPEVPRMFAAAATVNRMPEPKLVWDSMVAMPWMTRNVEARIAYWPEVTDPVAGGYNVAARVKRRYYATIAIPRIATDMLDLSGYARKQTIGAIAIFERKP